MECTKCHSKNFTVDTMSSNIKLRDKAVCNNCGSIALISTRIIGDSQIVYSYNGTYVVHCPVCHKPVSTQSMWKDKDGSQKHFDCLPHARRQYIMCLAGMKNQNCDEEERQKLYQDLRSN